MFVRSWYEDLWNILGFRFSEYYLGLVGLLRGIEHWFSSILLEITREDQGKMVTSDSSSDSPPLPPIPKQYGVTKPLSLSGPTDADIRRTKELEKVRLFCFPLNCDAIWYSIFCYAVYFSPLFWCVLDSTVPFSQFLEDSGLYESAEETAKREHVLSRLKQVCQFLLV